MTTNDIDAIRKLTDAYDLQGDADVIFDEDGYYRSYAAKAHTLAHRVPALCDEIEQLRAEREHMELNPTGTAEWLKNRVAELTAELEKVRAQLAAERARTQETHQ